MMILGSLVVIVTLALFLTPVTGRGSTIPVQKTLRELAVHFNGTVPMIRLAPYIKGFYKKHKFTFTYIFQQGNVGDPFALHVKLFPQKKSNLCIYLYDRDPGTVLNAKRAKTDDDQFDGEFFVYSNLPEEARRFFYDGSHRSAVRLLKEQEWHLNYIKGDVIKATTGKITSDVSPQVIENVLNQLLSLQISN